MSNPHSDDHSLLQSFPVSYSTDHLTASNCSDRYDGDERAQNAESIPTPDIPLTASQIAINQTPNTENDNDKQMLDVKDDPGPEFSTQEQYAPSRVEPGDLGQDWHTEELASSGVEHLHSMHAEEVSHTGIKEDG